MRGVTLIEQRQVVFTADVPRRRDRHAADCHLIRQRRRVVRIADKQIGVPFINKPSAGDNAIR